MSDKDIEQMVKELSSILIKVDKERAIQNEQSNRGQSSVPQRHNIQRDNQPNINQTPRRASSTAVGPNTYQEKLKATIQSELGYQVYQAIYVDFQKMVSRMKRVPHQGMMYTTYRVHEVQFSNAVESTHRHCCSNMNWGSQTLGNRLETSFYDPIQNMLDNCIKIGYAALRKTYRNGERSYYDGLKFMRYDTETGDKSHNSAGALKPDLIGYIANGGTTSKQTVKGYWGAVPTSDPNGVHIEIAVEVKSNWRDLVAQAGTYARCQFIASPGRTFVLVLGFNQKQGSMRFLLYHRSGLSASEEIYFYNERGHKQFLGIFIAMLSWSRQSDAGFPEYTNGVEYFFRESGNRYSVWRVVSTYHDASNCIRGRATGVYKLEKIAIVEGANLLYFIQSLECGQSTGEEYSRGNGK